MRTATTPVPAGTGPGYPRGDTLTALVDRWVRDTPTALALVDGDVRLGYADLDRAAEVTAGLLHRHGVRPGDRVPVLLPRSAAFVVTALAVMRLGAAYAGADRRWPAPRLRRVLDVLDCPVVVGDEVPAGVVGSHRRLVPVPQPPVAAGSTPDPRPPVRVRGTHACAVTFTSGSTGEPKCIPQPHRGIVRMVDVTPLPPGPAPVSLHSCALPWDPSLLEIWSALTRGGTCVVLRDPYLTPDGLRAVTRAYGVDTIVAPTSVFHLLVDEAVDCFAGLRTVQVGGEAMSPLRAGRFLAAHPGTTLFNLYGPTESSVVTTARRVTPEDCADADGVPIGVPIAHTGAHVRADDHWCGPDEPGELLISGDGLTPGYLGAAAAESAAFVELDLPDGRRRRVYRTGDLVRRSADGVLRYLGRLDRQVKIRGFRVEPTEIERAAATLDGVTSSVVVPRPHPAGGYRDTVLCYVPHADGGPQPDAVRAHLAAHLPAHLVPGAVVAVERYPLTPIGKVDEAAVLALAAALVRPDDGPPLDETGELVGRIVAEVLDLPAAPAGESLFALGATSLDVARICARLTDRTGVTLAPAQAMRAPTVRGLAAWLADPARRTPPPAVPAPPRQRASEVALTGAQTGFVLLHDWDPTDPGPLCPTVWTLTGPLDADALRDAVADLHHRHDALRHAYRLVAGRGVAEPVDAPAPEPRHLPPAADHDGALAALTPALTAPLDPPRGVLWRVVVAPCVDGTALLGVCVHHVAYDGWSHSVLVDELGVAYAARRRGAAPDFDRPVLDLPGQLAAVTARSDGADLDRQRADAARALRDLPELPLPRPPAGRRGDVRAAVCELPPAVPTAVLRAARDAGVAPLAVWLSAYARTLAALTGATDFGVGIPVVRRTGDALENCVGCAIGTVCVRVRGGSGASLRHTGDAVRAALSCQDVPFDEVVRLVNPRRTSRPPLYQTVFALQNVPYRDLRLPGVTVDPHLVPLVPPMMEVETEVRIAGHRAHVVVNGRPDAVTGEFVTELAERFAADLTAARR
ncbi:AMP-binding protein [Micromonospora sp. NPDC050980]|uniref:AMP-binding protein n=1 Tax=Micromonospora sp. NPDC050980 TaxID=3155161 RepID=UPI0033EAF403